MIPVRGVGMLFCGDRGASYSGPVFPFSCALVLPEMLTESLSLRNIHFKEMRSAQLAQKSELFYLNLLSSWVLILWVILYHFDLEQKWTFKV